MHNETRNISIKFYRTSQRPAAQFVSGSCVHEECLQQSRWISLYWFASGQVQRETISDTLPGMNPSEFPLHAFDLELDGQDLRNRWEFVSASEQIGAKPGTREAVVELRHQVRPVTLKVITRLDGTPFLVRRLEITNTGKAPAALSHVSPWSGMLWTWRQADHWGERPREASAPFVLAYFRGLMQGTEGDFGWEVLPPGVRRIEGTNGHSGFGNPFFMIRNEMTGETAIGALAWSGNWFMEFWRDPSLDLSGQPARGANLAFRFGPLGPAPLRVIAPGETVVSPETHLALLHASTDDCVAALHGHLRASVIPPRPEGKEFFTVAGRVVEEPGNWILKEMDIAAAMGVDAFMVDAGWYGDTFGSWTDRRGDWEVGDWMPGGLAGCRSHCHERGMMFGLWMEPETAGSKSKLLRDHPDWLLKTDGDREVAQMLDLSHPGAAQYMTEAILRTIKEHRLDFFKIDYNCRVHEGGQRERDGLIEHELWRHYEALYSVFDRVRAEMPEVALECCSSGGGRNDLGMMSRFHYACESDFSTFPRSIRAINGLTMFLPPEALCYYHNHVPVAHQKADLETHLRVTLFAQPVFVGFGAQAADRTTPYFELTKRYIALAKKFTGQILASRPRVFHHTPNIGLLEPADWCVLEYAAQDQSRGYAGLFKLTSNCSEYRFYPRGADISVEYEVTLDNHRQTFRISGSDLLNRGLRVRLDTPMTSELVLYAKMPH
ncbi:alpha-galactosidase [candidate division KSB1 bacterium]|nr:alpha-galactosidase [candidate division KSB1 bacterium]